jgi:hypothetical protein
MLSPYKATFDWVRASLGNPDLSGCMLDLCRVSCGGDPMWACIRCGSGWSVKEATPNIDDFGVHFICPTCGRRNNLKDIGTEKHRTYATRQTRRQFAKRAMVTADVIMILLLA